MSDESLTPSLEPGPQRPGPEETDQAPQEQTLALLPESEVRPRDTGADQGLGNVALATETPDRPPGRFQSFKEKYYRPFINKYKGSGVKHLTKQELEEQARANKPKTTIERNYPPKSTRPEQALDPLNLGALRLAIEAEVRDVTQRSHTLGEHVANGFSTDKVVKAITNKHLEGYFGVDREELESGEHIPPKLEHAVRGLLSLPMHEFMVLAHAMETPYGKKAVLDRDWQGWQERVIEHQEAARLRAERRQQSARQRQEQHLHTHETPADLASLDEAQLIALDQEIGEKIRDEVHKIKDARGVDKLPPEEFKELSNKVKLQVLLEHLGSDASPEALNQLSSALQERFARGNRR